ncbi:MAG: metallophosphoesterase [Ignavibacterium sp.]|nr:metallophosphoesterase [Ignavibacterium sp.]MDW8376180.1 metallophosphoesterase [Ignavibacteriales bacterium]
MLIAHLSDLHLNTLLTDSNIKKIERLLDYIIEKRTDHLVITGDLVDNADESDLLLLRNHLYKRRLLNSKSLTIIPGNHDIFGGPQRAEDIFDFPSRCRKVNFKEKLSSFNKYFQETFEDCIYISSDNNYPFLKELNDEVVIIGLNSIIEYSLSKNTFASNGEIKLEQFFEVEQILKNYCKENQVKIIAIHHHFNKIKKTKRSIAGIWQNIEKQTMKLRKKKRLFNLFNKYKVDLIIHGHIHYNEHYERKGLNFINGGASIKGYSGQSIRVNFIEINNKNIICTLHKITKTGEIKVEELFSRIKSVKDILI